MNTTINFKETQRFTQWWLWVILIAFDLFAVYLIYSHFVIDKPIGDHPLPSWGVLLYVVFTFALFALFVTMRLETTINRSGIYINFFPLISKHIPWESIASAEMVDYGFVGGWGIRLGTKYGTVYNVKGNLGLALRLKTGKKLCIGTQKAEELKRVIEKATIYK